MNKQLVDGKLNIILNQVNDIIDHCNNNINDSDSYNYLKGQMDIVKVIIEKIKE
jgi:hypothetical protein